ncbi:MAG: orotidine-5'-phosphate decarboxylase, partial [Clostridiales Family XIII bacterium]|nr:orotidine-5'-phosphate decarboxylase [Clostridiales Family XIII bacterium]
MMQNIDRLIARIDELNNPTVVGLDPTLEMIPPDLKEAAFKQYGDSLKAVSEMFVRFNKAIIDSVADIVPAVKPQIAMYEKYGIEGLSAYVQTTAYAAAKGLYVIGDIKRGDIASTAAAYAAHLSGAEIGGAHVDCWHEDAVTVNPYLGSDGVDPFVKACETTGKAIFILVKTSNPSSGELQDLHVAPACADSVAHDAVANGADRAVAHDAVANGADRA